MSQAPQPSIVGNGAPSTGPTTAAKRRIATASFDGHVGKIEFTSAYGGTVIEIDFTKLPASIQPSVGAYGAVGIVQTAYNASDKPVEAAQEAVKRLMAGDWRPGLTRREAEPDALIVALAEHLGKDHAYAETVAIPRHMERGGFATVGAARRDLRSHPDIAPRIAVITAERAKRAADAAKKAPRKALDL